MTYRIVGLDPLIFRPLFALDDETLKASHIERLHAASSSGTPCRISLEDARAGDEVLLLNYEHLDAASPYRASGPIFVRRAATERDEAAAFVDEVPEVLVKRLMSVRAYDASAHMIDAQVCEGISLDAQIRRLFAMPSAAWLQVHNARQGCYAAAVERA